ncbi:MAG TPA: type III pantothenate kinase [Candidatus Limnocylindrales bacterium]|jgi:type III pantothenate kinase
MLLSLDVGNTNLSVGMSNVGEPSGFIGEGRIATSPRDITADAFEALLARLLGLEDRPLEAIVQAIVIASVIPAWSAAAAEVARRCGIPILEASSTTVPIPIRIDRPADAGADRVVNAFAAGRLYGTPAIVVDLGTATTLDVVAADGGYLGGAIAAGLQLGLDALASGTALLPRVELSAPVRVIGRDTISAMQSGAVIGHIGLVNELVHRTRAELASQSPAGARIHGILTGGLSNEAWAKEIRGIDSIDPSLTIRGLVLFHAEVGAPANTLGVAGTPT